MPGFFMGRLAGHRLARHAAKNLKENMAVELDLVKLKAGWRIDALIRCS